MKTSYNNTSINFYSRKVPRYLYHLTSTDCLNKIKESGKIKIAPDTLGFKKSGIFLLELENFAKYWKPNKDWDFNNLAYDLLKQCSNGTMTLSLIRIPVDKLDKNILRIRSLNKLFRANERSLHETEGISATESKKYKAKKNAIEYIYPKEININNIEILGSIENYRNILRKKRLSGLLLELLKDQPEENCIKSLQ